MVDPVEEGFLSSLRARPDDDATRVVYADWLEERARTTESEFLRLQIALRTIAPEDPRFERLGEALRKIALQLDPTWRTVVSRAPIEGCISSVRFDFVCPKQWDALASSGLGDDIRFCGACKQFVYYSTTVAEAYENARLGRCVVVDLVQLRKPGDLEPPKQSGPIMMGSVALPPEWLAPPDTERD